MHHQPGGAGHQVPARQRHRAPRRQGMAARRRLGVEGGIRGRLCLGLPRVVVVADWRCAAGEPGVWQQDAHTGQNLRLWPVQGARRLRHDRHALRHRRLPRTRDCQGAGAQLWRRRVGPRLRPVLPVRDLPRPTASAAPRDTASELTVPRRLAFLPCARGSAGCAASPSSTISP